MQVFSVLVLAVASVSAFVAPPSMAAQSVASRSSAVSMAAKKKKEAEPFALGDFLSAGRPLELLSGANRKEDISKRFDITYDTRSRKATKQTGNPKSGKINPKDA